MGREPASFRTRLLSLCSRFLHRAGGLALVRPLVNRARLKLDSTGRPTFPYIRFSGVRNAQILIYHRVNDERDPYFGGTPVALFDRQMEYVASHFHVLPLLDLISGLQERALPDNAIAVTLDDGYRDNYLHAFPIFQKYGVPATIFLATSAIGTSRQIWHDDVFSAFRETQKATLEAFGPERIRGPLLTVPDRLRTQGEVLRYIRTLGAADRAAAVSRLRDALCVGPSGESPGLMLSWEEVATMSRAGVRFESHTATHPILSRVDRAEARREFAESKSTIEGRLGVRVEGLAYPNGRQGDFLPETKALLRECGYKYAVTTIPGPNAADVDVYELRRGTPWEEDIFAFGARLHYNKLLA
jgi:peptidoglycan/xylan/chitin deacetylase (PgdA/CDA1 family)